MPERNHLASALHTSTSNTSIVTNGVPSVLGWRQYILGLNKGRYIPGEYRCNGNRIFQVQSRGTPTLIPKQTFLGQKIALEGDVAAAMFGSAVCPCLGDLTPSWNSTLEREAVNKSYAKIVSSDLDLGVQLGELRETVEGLRNPLSSLRKELEWASKNWNKLLLLEDALQGAKHFKTMKITDSIDRLTKRLAVGGLPKSANALAGTWLEWRYGLRPLIQTIQDVLEHLKEQQRAFEKRLQKRGGKTSVIETVRTTDVSYSAGHFGVYGTCTRTDRSWVVAKTAFTLPSPLTWQMRYGLDYSNLPAIAWELRPLSFVVDWIVSIGTMLQSLRVHASPAIIHGTSVTMRTDATAECAITKFVYGGAEVKPSQYGTYSWNLHAMQRKCLSPGFNNFVPSLNSKALNLQQTLDGLALTWQRLPSLKPIFMRKT